MNHIQNLHAELIRASSLDQFDGNRIVDFFEQNPETYLAFFMKKSATEKVGTNSFYISDILSFMANNELELDVLYVLTEWRYIKRLRQVATEVWEAKNTVYFDSSILSGSLYDRDKFFKLLKVEW